jgi:hypothetical protein
MQLRSGKNIYAWPSWVQADRLATDNTNIHDFIKHLQKLQGDYADNHRIVIMASAKSIMNVSRDSFMRNSLKGASAIIVEKFNEYNGVKTVWFDKFLNDFKVTALG